MESGKAGQSVATSKPNMNKNRHNKYLSYVPTYVVIIQFVYSVFVFELLFVA